MRCGGCIMIEDENTAWLISMLESEMAEYRHYTPRKQWSRYPVQMHDSSTDRYYERRDAAITTNYKDAVSKYYEFGYNQFYIGQAIERVLQILENRYDLDFSSLEEEYYYEHSDDEIED